MELQIDVEEFADYIRESAKRFLQLKTREGQEYTPEMLDSLLFESGRIPRVTTMIDDFVYFITDGEYVKIGKGLPVHRMKSCQTGNARRLRLLFTIPIGPIPKDSTEAWRISAGRTAEDILHNLFGKYNINGEWFDILGLIDIERCREYFGTICSTSIYDMMEYQKIVERRRKEE